MNHHLQLFRFFHESQDPTHIEKNLTRALALCLKNDKVLLYSFLKDWLIEEDFNYLLSNPPEEAFIDIDIEVETGDLVENTRKLYAIGLTENPDHENWTEILKNANKIDKSNFTDLVIAVKDITIVIEGKRTKEDSKQQLLQQILPFNENKDLKLKAFHISWGTVLHNIKRTHHFNILNKVENPFTISFLQLIERRFNHWIPTTPFKHLEFDAVHNTEVHWLEINKRLEQAMRSLGDDSLAIFQDRNAIIIQEPWASEARSAFDLELNEPFLILKIWPGNTKQQGYSVYNHSLDWTKAKILTVNNYSFSLKIERHLKFMHFNKFVTCINIPMDDNALLKKEINTPDNFHKNSGRWDIGAWDKLDGFFSEHLNMDWKKECKWHDHFENTDRSYLTLALGFCIQVRIPYAVFQEIDKSQEDYKAVGALLNDCVKAVVAIVRKD